MLSVRLLLAVGMLLGTAASVMVAIAQLGRPWQLLLARDPVAIEVLADVLLLGLWVAISVTSAGLVAHVAARFAMRQGWSATARLFDALAWLIVTVAIFEWVKLRGGGAGPTWGAVDVVFAALMLGAYAIVIGVLKLGGESVARSVGNLMSSLAGLVVALGIAGIGYAKLVV